MLFSQNSTSANSTNNLSNTNNNNDSNKNTPILPFPQQKLQSSLEKPFQIQNKQNTNIFQIFGKKKEQTSKPTLFGGVTQTKKLSEEENNLFNKKKEQQQNEKKTNVFGPKKQEPKNFLNQTIKPASVIPTFGIKKQQPIQNKTFTTDFNKKFQVNLNQNATPLFTKTHQQKQMQQLFKKMQLIQEKLNKSQEKYDKLKNQFEQYKKQNNRQKYEQLRKQVQDLKGKQNLQRSQIRSQEKILNQNQTKQIITQFKQGINYLKQHAKKKQNDLQKTIIMIQKQSNQIESQTMLIKTLQNQMLQLNKLNMNQNNLNKPNNLNNQIPTSALFNNNNNNFNNNNNLNNNNNNSLLNNSLYSQSRNFNNPQMNPNFNNFNNQNNMNNMNNMNNFNNFNRPDFLSRSAVFSNTGNNTQFPSMLRNNNNQTHLRSYVQDGYHIKYQQHGTYPTIFKLSVQNNFGRIYLHGPINKKSFESKKISQIFKIVENSCEVIDPQWQRKPMRLVTYNFMNSRVLPMSEKQQFKQKIKYEAERNGLIFESYNPFNGDLCLLTTHDSRLFDI